MTLSDEIIKIIKNESNNNPPPKSCIVIGNYDDKQYCDVEVEDLGKLLHNKTIGSTKIGSEGIICFLNGDLKQGVVITPHKSESNLDIDFDVDFNLNFGVSGRDDILTIETFLKEK